MNVIMYQKNRKIKIIGAIRAGFAVRINLLHSVCAEKLVDSSPHDPDFLNYIVLTWLILG